MEDDWDRRIDRRFEELGNLLKELAAQRGLSIAPRTGPIQSSEGNSGGGPDDRTLLVKIHSMEYRISCEVLELLFSRFGILEDVEILDSGSEFHSKIRFRDRDSAFKAFESLNGRNIYDDCCRMELFLDRICGKANEMGAPIEDMRPVEKFENVDPSPALKVFEEIPNSQVQDRTLLVKIHLMQYSISCLELDKVFSRFGDLEKIEILSSQTEFHSKVCFKNKEPAIYAFNSVNGRDIYDGCCRMELFLMSNLGNEQSISNEIVSSCEVSRNESFLEGEEMFNRDEKSAGIEMGNDPNVGKEAASLVARQVFDEMSDSQIYHEQEFSFEMGTVSQVKLNLKVPTTMINQEQDNLEVIPDVAKVSASGVVAYRKLGELVEDPFDYIKVGLDNFKVNSFEYLANSSANNVIDEMPTREFITWHSSDQLNQACVGMSNCVFYPGDFIDPILAKSVGLGHLKFSKVKDAVAEPSVDWLVVLQEFLGSTDATSLFVFDPGGVGKLCDESPFAVFLTNCCWASDRLILFFDPSGDFLYIVWEVSIPFSWFPFDPGGIVILGCI